MGTIVSGGKSDRMMIAGGGSIIRLPGGGLTVTMSQNSRASQESLLDDAPNPSPDRRFGRSDTPGDPRF